MKIFRFCILIWAFLVVASCGDKADFTDFTDVGCVDGGDFVVVDPPSPEGPPTPSGNPFAPYNGLEPRDWFKESRPYSCDQRKNPESPWLRAGLIDLGGSDPLSLIRYFGNGSYFKYEKMYDYGCTLVYKYSGVQNEDWPIDPKYYSLGDLEIHVDIARVPPATKWGGRDDGTRVEFSMERAVALLNQHVADYYRRISQGKLRITFRVGNEFTVGGDGRWMAARNQQLEKLGICVDVPDCENHGFPGALNRILLNDVEASSGGFALGGAGWASLGLVSFRDADMENIIHEIGHAWMLWPHSFAELFSEESGGLSHPDQYSNFYDPMSALKLRTLVSKWDSNMPSTLAINRYSAGWVEPEDVALHLEDSKTYTLSKPFGAGKQFLVIHSGRLHAFTTLEVLEERSPEYKLETPICLSGGARPRRYEGVLVSRYDQTSGTGFRARLGPALYDRNHPNFLSSAGWDDYSLIPDGETREIGGGVRVAVRKKPDGSGSYEITVSGGKVAPFPRWCNSLNVNADTLEEQYDTGCVLSQRPQRR